MLCTVAVVVIDTQQPTTRNRGGTRMPGTRYDDDVHYGDRDVMVVPRMMGCFPGRCYATSASRPAVLCINCLLSSCMLLPEIK